MFISGMFRKLVFGKEFALSVAFESECDNIEALRNFSLSRLFQIMLRKWLLNN